ncbi:hypothetical protein NDU88_001108 [Pleurodeles waltl]|uniref:Uncharacterized protein n=1 Tax=Pleurodeles waltl TaxID=8319 RepID=A0AAV7V9Z8_PLEWA|nr:hypothetical protein NDU88_001108 [Pleurodeles waltl]
MPPEKLLEGEVGRGNPPPLSPPLQQRALRRVVAPPNMCWGACKGNTDNAGPGKDRPGWDDQLVVNVEAGPRGRPLAVRDSGTRDSLRIWIPQPGQPVTCHDQGQRVILGP